MQIKELEKLLRKELNIEIGKKMNRKLGRINDREFEKGMWFQQRLFNIAIEHIENKLKIKIYEVTTPHSPHDVPCGFFMDKSVFKVIGINDNLPEGFRLVEFADLPEVMNNAEKHGILRGEYYLFKQFEKRNKDKYPYSVLWLSRLDYYSIVIGSLMDYDIDRVRGVLIIKETNKKVEESKDGKER